jgi:hypothetical protein
MDRPKDCREMEKIEHRFKLILTNQHWIEGSTDPNSELYDLTSHGKIFIFVNGINIAGESDLGINQSAVALLQTIFNDHIPEHADSNIEKPLFFHGCYGYGTCPNRVIDFRVIHQANEKVKLDSFYVTGHETDDPKKYYNIVVELSQAEYSKQVLEFAEQALMFLPKHRKADKTNKWELDIYHSWRNELIELIEITKDYIKKGVISSEMRSRAGKFDLSTGGVKF